MQAHGPLAAAVPQGDVEPAVEHQEELIGVVVNVPDVLAPDMRDPDVVVVDPADDPRAVDVAEGSQCLAQADGGDCHASIVAARADGRDGAQDAGTEAATDAPAEDQASSLSVSGRQAP
jgi:hypothetical protein